MRVPAWSWVLGWAVACQAVPTEPVPTPRSESVDATPAPAAAPGAPLTVDIVVDATQSATGWLQITEQWRGIAGPFSLRAHGEGGAYSVRKVRFSAEGRVVGMRSKGHRYEVRGPVPSALTVTYEVRPGVEGRHGRQGWADDRFAVFDGRAWLLPISHQTLSTARFRFELPEGWSAATALQPAEDGWWVADPPSGSVLNERLLKECHGVGPWERSSFVRGDTEVRSFVHAELSPELRSQVMEDTQAVWGWFHDTLGFDPGYPMAFVRTPSLNGGRIFGGASMMGACYEAEWSRRPQRNRYLLGHRFGHPFNKYPPAGWTPHGPEEHWFTEAWASYAEVLAMEDTGRIEAGTYFSNLWAGHRDRLAEHPAWTDVPMIDEVGAKEGLKEYHHYVRGPLLTRTLAHLVTSRSPTTLEAFVRHLASEVGGHRRPYRLQQELESFTGADFEDFWEAYVRHATWLVPSFPGVVNADVRDRALEPMVAETEGVGVSAEYLAALAGSGRFHDVDALLTFVGQEGPTRRALADGGVTLVPDEVLAHVAGLPPWTRESLVRAEADWPLHALGRVRARVEPSLQWLDHPWASRWKDWAARDARDRAQTLAGGVDRIALRVGAKAAAEQRPDVLAVSPDAPMTLYVWWREPVAAARVELLHEDTVAWSMDITEQPGWIRNRLVVRPEERPAASGLLTVRVLDRAGGLLGQRRFLQWAPRHTE